MTKCKAIFLKFSPANSEDDGARIIRCSHNIQLCIDYEEFDGWLDSMGFPDYSALDAGLWIFEGELGESQEFSSNYTGTYRRPTHNELEDLIHLRNEWAAIDTGDLN